MKNYAFLILAAVFLTGCQPDTQASVSNDDSTSTVTKTDSLVELIARPYPLDSFPKQWFVLTESGDGEVPYLYQWCDAEIQSISLEEEEHSWRFSFNYGQEADSWKLGLFMAYAWPTNTGDSIAGSIQVMDHQSEDQVFEEIYFTWEPAENSCYFESTITGHNRYVNKEAFDAYELVEENCEGMFE